MDVCSVLTTKRHLDRLLPMVPGCLPSTPYPVIIVYLWVHISGHNHSFFSKGWPLGRREWPRDSNSTSQNPDCTFGFLLLRWITSATTCHLTWGLSGLDRSNSVLSETANSSYYGPTVPVEYATLGLTQGRLDGTEIPTEGPGCSILY